MPRKLRQQRLVPNQPNHIVCRGNNRRRLFSHSGDYLRYLFLLKQAVTQFECALHALCLMGNHVHLLITPPTVGAASSAMQKVNQRYAQIRNKLLNGSGKLFEDRFGSEPVETIDHLKFVVLYINANPHAAFLRNKDRYRWSTQALYAGQPTRDITSKMITYDSWYLGLGDTGSSRAEVYQHVFAEYLVGKHVESEYLEQALRMEPKSLAPRPLRPNGSNAAEKHFDYAIEMK